MKKINIKGIRWVLEDDSIEKILYNMELRSIERREHKIIKANGERYFLKSFRENGISDFFRRLLYPRGKKEFIMGKTLLSFSINTPEPLGYGVSRGRSYIIQRHLSGKNFLELFYESEEKKEMLNQLAMLLKTLKAHKIKHNDLHLNNIIIQDGKPYIIDLHKMEIKRHFSFIDEVSNISHSLAMIYKEMSEDEKESFFTAYGKKDLRNTVEFKLDKMWERWIKSKKKRAFKDTSIVKREKEVLYIKGTEWQREDI
ncbi:MAG: hypothetical protein N2596_01110, partial [Syntrophorhabdaceae bacterium]|nr:hypothetical protein [Syntrophorhabdaceae bacterium]